MVWNYSGFATILEVSTWQAYWFTPTRENYFACRVCVCETVMVTPKRLRKFRKRFLLKYYEKKQKAGRIVRPIYLKLQFTRLNLSKAAGPGDQGFDLLYDMPSRFIKSSLTKLLCGPVSIMAETPVIFANLCTDKTGNRKIGRPCKEEHMSSSFRVCYFLSPFIA